MEVSLCRCCLMQGSHKNLNTTYIWFNKKEVYAEMLQECFNIVLSSHPQHGNGICENCVSSLRSAHIFKQGVLDAEKELTNRLTAVQELKDEVHEETILDFKEEPISDADDDSDDYFLADVRDRSMEEEIKTEVKEEPPKKRSHKRKNVVVKSDPEESFQNLVEKLNGIGTQIIDKKKKDKKKKTKTKIFDLDEIQGKTWWKRSDKLNHTHNVITILENSNAVPFKNKNSGYACGFCEAGIYPAQELRQHVENKHKNGRSKYRVTPDHTDLTVQVDVTDLKCTICDEKMENLDIFKEHLVKKHNKTIYSMVKEYIMQFKLKNDEIYDCVLCSATYETFKMLKQHMNQHYRNYSCDKCDTTFANKKSLRTHNHIHMEGSFKCRFCDIVFTNIPKKTNHEKTIHLKSQLRKMCPHCNESFTNYYQRNQHLVKVHNLEAKYRCNVCEKTYVLKSLLMYHIKKSHLMERNCQCSECGYRFFSKKSLKAHMVKHTGEKDFTCSVCNKSYARKSTLREHMRIHTNDRRFKCDICQMTFVQKCSLKSHLLSNHGISMAASDITCIDSVSNNH